MAISENSRSEEVRLGVLADSLGFMLRLAQVRAFDDYFKAFSDTEMRPGTISVLTIIAANPGIRHGELARKLRIKPANMTKMIRALEASGLIERHVPEDDRRAIELRLTAKGGKLAERFAESSPQHEMQSFAPLTPDERDELMRLLTKYVGL